MFDLINNPPRAPTGGVHPTMGLSYESHPLRIEVNNLFAVFRDGAANTAGRAHDHRPFIPEFFLFCTPI